MNQAAARIPNAVTETLVVDHGDTDTRPMPAPSISSARDRADATTAPATMAPQDTAEAPLSKLASSSRAFKIASEGAANVALDMRNLLGNRKRSQRAQRRQ